jgi:hypothetical protein
MKEALVCEELNVMLRLDAHPSASRAEEMGTMVVYLRS